MKSSNQFYWIDFYKEFASILTQYCEDRPTLIKKIKDVFLSIGIKLPTLEKDNMIVDIDPFTVFGLFNKSIKIENRVQILRGIAKEFDVKASLPESFDSIPVLMPLNATFYTFIGDRKENDIDNLWSLFIAAMQYTMVRSDDSKAHFTKCFDAVINQKGVGTRITMGLYWIAPDEYLNLDSRNKWYIYESGKIPGDVVSKLPKFSNKPNSREYLEIKEQIYEYLNSEKSNLKNFQELSFEAWRYSEEVNQIKKNEVASETQELSKAAFIRWFKPLIQALRDLGGSATPQQAREKIIENEHLADEDISEIRGKTNVNKFENEVAFARNYLVYGGYIDKSVRGIWTLTEAGKSVDMNDEMASKIHKNAVSKNQSRRGNIGAAVADQDVDTVHYWIYAPGDNAGMWDEFYQKGILAIGWGDIGDLRAFASKDEIKTRMKESFGSSLSFKNAAHATWQFVNDMKPGDIVFAKKGMYKIVGRGIVTSDYEFDEERSDEYKNVRKIEWTHRGEWEHPGQAVMKTLTDITAYSEYIEKLKRLFEDEIIDGPEEKEVIYPLYSPEDFLKQVYMPETSYKTLVGLISNKKNVVLQGAPGVGKTYAAKRLAYSIIGEKNQDRVMMVQFHQSYSYEDFIMGFRPVESGFELKKGAFYNFCKKAEIDSDNDYFFIIDEINRGNLSKILGELFMLIENDKRGIELQLLYSDEKFSVPENLFIIGMMNTADRSLAMLDYALRRRFAFFEMKPGFETEGFRDYRKKKNNLNFDRLISCVNSLNIAIAADESLGEGFLIGHSYFCELKSVEEHVLSNIVEYELIPLLKEYWFDEPVKVKDWSNSLRSAIK